MTHAGRFASFLIVIFIIILLILWYLRERENESDGTKTEIFANKGFIVVFGIVGGISLDYILNSAALASAANKYSLVALAFMLLLKCLSIGSYGFSAVYLVKILVEYFKSK